MNEAHSTESSDAAALANTSSIDECTVCGAIFDLHIGFGWGFGSGTNKLFFVCPSCCDTIPADAILERVAACESTTPSETAEAIR